MQVMPAQSNTLLVVTSTTQQSQYQVGAALSGITTALQQIEVRLRSAQY